MSSKKGVGSSKNGRDSESKRLGLKVGAGEYVKIDGTVKFERYDKKRKKVSVYSKEA